VIGSGVSVADSAIVLLHNMGQLMCEELSSLGAGRFIVTAAEHDVAISRVGDSV
jgi:hypothetical protein